MDITLKLENFTGPLSLLYHLIEKNKIDIYDIPIAEITDQYISVINEAENSNMDGMSEFLLLAANLLEIKSRMLLPKCEDETEEEDPRAELVSKLIEYKKFKNVTAEFRQRAEEASLVAFKEADTAMASFKNAEDFDIDDFLEGITFDDLYKAFCDVMERKEQKTDKIRSGFNSVERDMYTVGDKINYIRDLLVVSPKIKFWNIFRKNSRKTEIIVTFIALLELIKMKGVSIRQDGIFEDIVITKYVGSDTYETERT
ncbi:MAG: segregation/condensation protein A [Firmicutes bacterium]|nr:segregation/condensation protein A [Bacillota bacterium]